MKRFSTHCLRYLSFSLLSLLVALPASTAAARNPAASRREHLDGIRARLDAGAWKEAAKLIARAEKQILERSRPERGDDRDLAELALYLAVVEANRGGQDAAEWYWYTAYNLHQPTAYRDVSAWGDAAEVFGSIGVRDLGRDPKGVKTFKNYPGRDFEEPEMPATRTPESLASSHALKEVRSIQVEVFLDERGVPHSPRLMGRPPQPILFYSWMVQLFEKRWRPARSEGEPVPMLVELSWVPGESRW